RTPGLVLSRRRPPPPCALLPYTTLFRSPRDERAAERERHLHGVHRRLTVLLAALRLRADIGRRGELSLRQAVHAVVLDDVEHVRSEEHTSELQSRENLVCRLLLEKKKK